MGIEIKPYKYKGTISLKDNSGHILSTNVYGNDYEMVYSQCETISRDILDQHSELEGLKISVKENKS